MLHHQPFVKIEHHKTEAAKAHYSKAGFHLLVEFGELILGLFERV